MSTYHFTCNLTKAVIEPGTAISIIPTSEQIVLFNGTHKNTEFKYPWNCYMYCQDSYVYFEPICFDVVAFEFPFIQISPDAAKQAYSFMQTVLSLAILSPEDEEEIYQTNKTIHDIHQFIEASSLKTSPSEPYRPMMSWACAISQLERLNLLSNDTLRNHSNWYAAISNIFGLFIEGLASGIPYALPAPDGNYTTHVMKASVFDTTILNAAKNTPIQISNYYFDNLDDMNECISNQYIKHLKKDEETTPISDLNLLQTHQVNKMLSWQNILNSHFLLLASSQSKTNVNKANELLKNGVPPKDVFKQILAPYFLVEYLNCLAIAPIPFKLSESPTDEQIANNFKSLINNIKQSQENSQQINLW